MFARMLTTRPWLFVVLVAPVLLSGCGKDGKLPTEPVHEGITAQQAQEVAVRFGVRGSTALNFAHAQVVPMPGARTAEGARRVRPAQAGSLADDGNHFDYALEAFNAAGSPVPYSTTPADQIARLVMNWNIRWDWASDPSFMRGRGAGRFDISGLLPSSSEVTLSGTSRDTMDYHVVAEGYESRGNGSWISGVDGLRWSKDWDAHPFPLSGKQRTIVDLNWSVSYGTTNESEHVKTDVLIVFDGTQWAVVTVDGRYQFRLDLTTGTVEPFPA